MRIFRHDPGASPPLLFFLSDPHAAAGLDNIATVLNELHERVDSARLAALSSSFERTVVQRLGYLLDRIALTQRTGPLYEALEQHRPLPWVELEPARSSDKDFRSQPAERNERWHVIVHRVPEIDE
jgi:AbiEi antitoxin C-terminal domain